MDIGKDIVNAICKSWWQKARKPLSTVILVNLGFHNKIPENGWLKQQTVISRGSGVWGAQGSVWSANLGVWWGPTSQFIEDFDRKGKRIWGGGVLFYKGTNPFLKVSALYLVACLKHNVGSTASIASDSLWAHDCIACQPPLSMGLSWQEYCSGLPVPPPGDLPDSGIEHASPAAPALAGFFTSESPGKPPPPNIITLVVRIST